MECREEAHYFGSAGTVHLSPCGRGRIASQDAIRVRGLSPRRKFRVVFAETDPSSVANCVRDTFSHKGRRVGVCRGISIFIQVLSIITTLPMRPAQTSLVR